MQIYGEKYCFFLRFAKKRLKIIAIITRFARENNNYNFPASGLFFESKSKTFFFTA